MDGWESPVEKAIREAQERGEFDNLPGAGKPLTGLGNTDDPDWWVKSYAARENLDLSAAMPPVLALRKEAASFPDSLLDLSTEAGVREVLADFNRRVRQDRLRPATGPRMPVLAPTVDVEDLVARWSELKQAAAARTDPVGDRADEADAPWTGSARRRPWWSVLRRRRR